MLTYFHTDTPLETDFRELTRLATEVSLAASDLRWYDWTRYSSRQLTKMELGGLLGSVEFHLDPGSPLWPYVWLGQFTHGGKATSMGLGRYEIAPASLRDRQDAEG